IHLTQVGTPCCAFVEDRRVPSLRRFDPAGPLRRREPVTTSLCPEGALPGKPSATPWETGQRASSPERAKPARPVRVPPLQGWRDQGAGPTPGDVRGWHGAA